VKEHREVITSGVGVEYLHYFEGATGGRFRSISASLKAESPREAPSFCRRRPFMNSGRVGEANGGGDGSAGKGE